MPSGGWRPGAGRPRTGTVYEKAVQAGFEGSRATWYRLRGKAGDRPLARPYGAEARIVELECENAALRSENAELRAKPDIDIEAIRNDVRRLDAIGLHQHRITTDEDTWELFRRCLHPDSRKNLSDELAHKVWIAFQNLERIIRPDGKRAYIGNGFEPLPDGAIQVFDTASHDVVATIPNPPANFSNDIKTTPDGRRAYTTNVAFSRTA